MVVFRSRSRFLLSRTLIIMLFFCLFYCLLFCFFLVWLCLCYCLLLYLFCVLFVGLLIVCVWVFCCVCVWWVCLWCGCVWWLCVWCCLMLFWLWSLFRWGRMWMLIYLSDDGVLMMCCLCVVVWILCVLGFVVCLVLLWCDVECVGFSLCLRCGVCLVIGYLVYVFLVWVLKEMILVLCLKICVCCVVLLFDVCVMVMVFVCECYGDLSDEDVLLSVKCVKVSDVCYDVCGYVLGVFMWVMMYNFMMYKYVMFEFGLWLNVVLGLNGIGKSVFVCVVCVGFGGLLKLFGRVGLFGDFVKRGEESVYTEIMLWGCDVVKLIIIWWDFNNCVGGVLMWKLNGEMVKYEWI